MPKGWIVGAVVISLISIAWFGGIFGDGNDEPEQEPFPEFSIVADDGVTYSNSDFAGAPYIVIFSAEWCDNPCHTTMHSISANLNSPQIIVLSTDPDEEPQGINLQEWHEKANAHDDDGDDLGRTLDFPFGKGFDVALEINIGSRPSVVFVDSDGGIVDIHKGGLTDGAEITSYWKSAGGTV